MTGRAKVVLTGLALVSMGLLAGRSRAESREALARRIEARVRDVPSVTTQELAAWLRDGRPLLLLDVRTRAEFEVSHLPGAEWAELQAQQRSLIARAPPDAIVVAYCSVGWRSAVAVERLLPAAGRPVYNLRGSLFQWANEGRPMTDGATETTVAHPFDRSWGQLLDCAHWPASWRRANGSCP